MARTPKTPAPSEATALVNWEQKILDRAKIAAAQASSVGGTHKFFSTRSGVLACDGQGIPNNEFVGVIVAAVLENAFYDGEFDSDNPSPPSCYAFGRGTPADMEPFADVVKAGRAQNASCAGCKQNEFGTAERGKGKACKNGWRLAVLPAGDYDAKKGVFDPILDPKHYAECEVRYLKVPPTSLGNYGKYVTGLATGHSRSPECVFTHVTLRPHPTKQFELSFEGMPYTAKELFPNALLQAVMERNEKEMELIEFPYPPKSDTPKAAPKTTGRKFTRKQ